MCGIAGIVDLNGRRAPEREALLRMAGSLPHRGPDEFGLYRDSTAGLAHARLSIIDISSGQQPLANEDETLWIVFNGEVFNYVELRAELVRLGHRFRTNSDTEVIVHAYEAWGEQAFARMNGQWAVALWDAAARRLVLARDRFGVRPLFLCEHAGRLYFGSEIKALFAADASIPRAFDPAGIDQTFTFWSTIAPRCVFRGIEELRPAHVRTYEGDRVREQAYWEPTYPQAPAEDDYAGSLDDAAAAVRDALARATSLRVVRSDVTVGSYLSGGLDSTLVAALARDAVPGRLQTFSVRFEESEYDEGEFQQLVVQQLESDHHEIVVSRRDIAEVFPDVVWHAERPILRTAPAPLFLLSRLVRRHGIKVVLTGEGADEMFGGYDLFREGKIRRFWARQPKSRSRPRALERLYPYLARSPVSREALARQFFGRHLDDALRPGFAHQTRWSSTAALKRLLSIETRDAVGNRDAIADLLGTLPQAFARWTPLAQDQYIEVRTLLSGYLLSAQGDRMLMANSVEGRFPFLDMNLVRLADALPPRYKLRALNEKYVLKQAATGLIPREVIARQKQPYRAPDALCFIGDASPHYVQELLGQRAVAEAGIFDAQAVHQLMQKCRARSSAEQFSNSDNMALVGVLSTQLLHHQYVHQRPTAVRTIRLQTDVDRVLEPA